MPNPPKNEAWQQEAIRLGGEFLIEVIMEMQEGQKLIIGRLSAMEDNHETTEGRIDRLYQAFPSSDVDGHCRFHQTMIESLEERRRLRIAIQEKTISGLIWAGIVGIGILMWHELQRLAGMMK